MAVLISDVVICNIVQQDITEANRVSSLKYPNIEDTFISGRTMNDKFAASFNGDVAKLTVKRYLENNGFDVTDWDSARTNWTSSTKDFDLKININNKAKTEHLIEVKSSFAKSGETLQNIIDTKNIISPEYSDIQEVTIQVYYPDKNYKLLWLCAWALKDDLGDSGLLRYLSAFDQNFYMMPFSHRNAQTIAQLLTYL